MAIFMIGLIFCCGTSYLLTSAHASSAPFPEIRNPLAQGIRSPSTSFVTMSLSSRMILSKLTPGDRGGTFSRARVGQEGQPKSSLALTLAWISGEQTQVIRMVCTLNLSMALSSKLAL